MIFLVLSKLVSYRDFLFEIVDFALKYLYLNTFVFPRFICFLFIQFSMYTEQNPNGFSSRSLTIVKLSPDFSGLGGDERDRTDDPLLAKQVLSQLSYTPIFSFEYQAIFSCARPYSPEVPFYRALKIKQRLQERTS